MCVSEWMWMCILEIRRWSQALVLAFHLVWSSLFTVSCSTHQASWPVGFWGFCLCLPPQSRSAGVIDMCTPVSGFMWVQLLTLSPQALYPFRHHSRPWVEEYEWCPTSQGGVAHICYSITWKQREEDCYKPGTAWATKWYHDSKTTTTKQSNNDKTKPKLEKKVILYPWG